MIRTCSKANMSSCFILACFRIMCMLCSCPMIVFGDAGANTFIHPAINKVDAQHYFPPHSPNWEFLSTDHGYLMVKRHDGGVAGFLRELNNYELPAMKAMVQLIQDIGTWALTLATLLDRGGSSGSGSGVTVHAFEAVKELYFQLGTNILLNQKNNIVTHFGVISDRVSEMATPVLVDRGGGGDGDGGNKINTGAFSLSMMNDALENEKAYNLDMADVRGDAEEGGEKAGRPLPTTGVRYTKTYRLDDFFLEGEFASSSPRRGEAREEDGTDDSSLCPAFIKIDVEGHELAVLQGSLALLSRCRPILYLEILCEALSRPILTLLDSLGYASAWVITGNSEGPDFIYFSVLFRSLTSGTNIAAVPKHRAESLATGASTLKVLINDTSGDIFVEMANGYAFFPIDVTAKLFTLRDQQIFLTSKPRNDRRNVVAARQDLYGDGQCQLISQTDIDSWRSLVNPATLSLYEE